MTRDKAGAAVVSQSSYTAARSCVDGIDYVEHTLNSIEWVPSPCAWDVLTYKICKLREPQRTQLTKSLNFAQEK